VRIRCSFVSGTVFPLLSLCLLLIDFSVSQLIASASPDLFVCAVA
jgi:hypothetical protein